MTVEEKAYLYDSVGNQIRELRKNAGFSQQDLADKLGKSRVSIVNIEKGRQHPPLHLLVEFARIFNKNLNDLLPSEFLHSKNEQKKLVKKVNKEIRTTSKSSGEIIEAEKILEFFNKAISKK